MAGFFDKLRQGLSRTGSGIAAIFTGSGIDDEFYEELEEALIMADVGMATTDKLLSGLRDAVAEKKIKERSEARNELISLLADLMRPEKPFLDGTNRAVIMVVGVNGVGKTTSLGKIAAYYKNQGRDVVLAAADTFRAGRCRAAHNMGRACRRANNKARRRRGPRGGSVRRGGLIQGAKPGYAAMRHGGQAAQ